MSAVFKKSLTVSEISLTYFELAQNSKYQNTKKRSASYFTFTIIPDNSNFTSKKLNHRMSTPSPTTTVPLMERLADTLNQDVPKKTGADEKTAAASALASLSSSPNSYSVMEHTKPTDDDDSHGNVSDSENSYSSRNSVLPKVVHAPPKNSMMVDHKYTDYSVIDEKSLAYLEQGDNYLSTLSGEVKKDHVRRMRKVKKMFGDVVPSKKNSGGVVKPFPAKVRICNTMQRNGMLYFYQHTLRIGKRLTRILSFSLHLTSLLAHTIHTQLMEVLDRPDMDTIITWMPHGRAFIVLQPQQLRDNVLPRFFKQTKFMSFTRQLNLWGFKRITKGDDSGAYYHELFLRTRPRLAMLMRRQKIKGTGIKLTPNPETEPNFYKISEKRPLPANDPSNWKNKPLPPLRRNPQAKQLGASANTIDYGRMAQHLNSRPDMYEIEQQVNPFNNSSSLAGLISQGMSVGSNTNLNHRNSLAGLSATQGMNNGLHARLHQRSLAGSAAAAQGLNGNVNDNFVLQQLLLRQQLQQPNGHLTGLAAFQGLNSGLNSNMNDSLSLQQLLLRQQLQSNSYREADQQHMQIAAAQRLLNQVNGPSPPAHMPMGNNSLHLQELKRRLLNAANSLDNINQQLQQQQQVQQLQEPLFQQFSSQSLLANLLANSKQQQQHPQNSTDINLMLRALGQSGTAGHGQNH